MHATVPVSRQSTRLLARTLALLFSLTLLAALFGGTVLAAPQRSAPQPMIVVFNDDVADPAGLTAQLGRAHGFEARFVYRHALKGFAATLSSTAAQALSANPRVAWVEPDGMAYPTQDNATWGLDRIDQLALPLDTKYNYTQTGSGVTAYVIDSGIEKNHQEFESRASYGWDFYDGDSNADDCNGHGTHVAGTIGGKTYGVAKNVNLVAVRVFGCSGGSSWSTIIAGVDWVTANAVKPAVANMSLGGSGNTSVDTAVRNSITSGVSYAIAAGNGNIVGIAQDACKSSPARVTEAMTISATDKSDTKASWANYGDCVDWFAPGVSITSAWHTSSTATNTISGTSMATPHTAGVAALCLEAAPAFSPAQVQSALAAATSQGVVSSSRSANNDMLQNTIADECGGGGGGGNNPPTAGNVSTSGDEDTVISWNPAEGGAEDGETLSCSIASEPSNGSATVDSDCGSGTYTPNADFNESDSFTYRVSDNNGGSASGTVSITVHPINDDPVASDDSYTATVDTKLIVNAPGVLDNDSDVDGDTLTAALGTGPSHGSVTLDGDGSFEYMPTIGYTGVDSFTYAVSDGKGGSGSATVTINVQETPSTMHVGDLDASSANDGSTWTAVVTIIVHDANENPVSGATVSGTWNGAVSGSSSCTTNENGQCQVSFGGIHKRNSSVTFTVTNITHATLSYDSSANHDDDGSSDGTTVTAFKP